MAIRRWGVVGALVTTAVVLTGSASASAGGGTTRGEGVDPGCGQLGGSYAVVPGTAELTQLASEPAAANWASHPVASNVGNSPYILLAVGPRSAIVLADDRATGDLIVRASSDSGTTWAPIAKLNGPSTFAAAAEGPSVDLLMARIPNRADGIALPADSSGQRLLYRRSLDGGARWSAAVRLGTLSYDDFAVARSGETVAVAWWNDNDNLKVRVSTDGGATFGAGSKIASFEGTSGCVDPGPGPVGVAISGRQVLVTYLTSHGEMIMRRGLHNGTHWTEPHFIDRHGGSFLLAAHGNDVVAVDSSVRELLSHDSGKTWQRVASPVGTASGELQLAWSDGKWRVAYRAADSNIRYRESTDAVDWSSSEVVPTVSGLEFMDVYNGVDVYGVASAGTPLVLVGRVNGGTRLTNLEVATRQ